MKIHRFTSAIGQLLATAVIASNFESGSVQGVELLRTIALSQQAPLLPASIGTGKFYSFDSPGLNDLGRSYFLGAIFAGSHSHDAVWSETGGSGLSLVGIDDTPIAGTSKQLELPQPPVGNGLNQLAFRSNIVTSPSSGPSRLGIWSGEVGHELHLTAFEGENPPGFPSSVQFFGLNSLPVISDTGRIVFPATLAGVGTVDATGNGNTIWTTAPDGTLQLVARGDSHPLGMSPDARFGDQFSGPQIDAANDIYFHTTLSDTTYNGVAIVRYRDRRGLLCHREER